MKCFLTAEGSGETEADIDEHFDWHTTRGTRQNEGRPRGRVEVWLAGRGEKWSAPRLIRDTAMRDWKKKITPQATFLSLLLKFNTSLQERCLFCFCLCGGQSQKHQSERHLHIRRTQELYTDPSLYSVWRWATAAQDHAGCYELRLQFTCLHQNWKTGGWRNVSFPLRNVSSTFLNLSHEGSSEGKRGSKPPLAS